MAKRNSKDNRSEKENEEIQWIEVSQEEDDAFWEELEEMNRNAKDWEVDVIQGVAYWDLKTPIYQQAEDARKAFAATIASLGYQKELCPWNSDLLAVRIAVMLAALGIQNTAADHPPDVIIAAVEHALKPAEITHPVGGPNADVADVPAKLLTGWSEIIDALEMNASDREKIKSLNGRFDGPIPKPKKGGQPIVDKKILVSWWNGLATMQQEMANQREGKRLSTENGHKYGRDGIAIPELRGEVKKRRSRPPT